jgi:hypothetical protein
MCGTTNEGKPCPLPKPSLFSEDNGNFVTSDLKPAQQIGGTMCFTSDLFFENKLVPLFKPLVKRGELTISELSVDKKDKNKFHWNFVFGSDPDHTKFEDEYFQMKRMKGPDDTWKSWFNNTIEDFKNERGWRWKSEQKVVEDKNEGFWRETSAKLTGNVPCNHM